MEIEYRIERKDIEAYYQYHFHSSPSVRRSYEMGYVWQTTGFIALFILFANKEDIWSVFSWMIAFIGCILLYRFSAYRNIKESVERFEKEGRNKGIWGRNRLTLNEDEMLETSAIGESRTLWTGVERIAQNKDYIFIYITAVSAFIIPKRAFKDNQEAEGFYSAARTYHEKANSQYPVGNKFQAAN